MGLRFMSPRLRRFAVMGSCAALALSLVCFMLSRHPALDAAAARPKPDQRTTSSTAALPRGIAGDRALVQDAQATVEQESSERTQRELGESLEGLVVDLDGRALAGTSILLWTEAGDRVERVSGTNGRFDVEALPGDKDWRVSADRGPEWQTCGVPGMLHLTPEGAWAALLVVMSGWGALEIQVVDHAGSPIHDAAVTVRLAAEEFASAPLPDLGQWTGALGAPRTGWISQAVDRDGFARFPRVWADHRLTVELSSGRSPLICERQVNGVLMPKRDGLAGELIRVPAGGELSLRAQLPGIRRTVAGRVGFADGRAVPRPAIFLRANGRPAGREFRSSARGNEDGTFSIVVDQLDEGEILRVRATDGYPIDQHTGAHSGGVELEVAGIELQAEIVVEPMLTVAGCITRAGSPPGPGTLRILPEPPEHPAAPDDIGYQPVDPKGCFEVSSLAPGRYELEFTERGFMADARYVLSGVQAGATNIQWELPEAQQVQLAVAIDAPRPVAQFMVLVAQRKARSSSMAWQPAAPQWTVSSAGWPHRSADRRQPSGQGQCSIAGTPFQYRLQRFDAAGKPAQQELALPEDVYALGAIAWDDRGRLLSPVLSEPAQFLTGRHEIRFVLVPTAAVEGVVEGARPDLGLELIVLDSQGRRLPLFDRGGATHERIALTSDGHFVADGLPAGNVSLRVSTPLDLERGIFGAEHKLELTPGETAEVTLRW